MKHELGEKIEAINKSKVPIVAIDPSLDKFQGKILFLAKLEIAEKKLKGVKVPDFV